MSIEELEEELKEANRKISELEDEIEDRDRTIDKLKDMAYDIYSY